MEGVTFGGLCSLTGANDLMPGGYPPDGNLSPTCVAKRKIWPLRFQLAEIGGPSRPEMSGPGDVITSNSEDSCVGPATAAGGVGDPTLCAWPTHLGERCVLSL
ncbi:hypothetical protein Bbelb_429700 [Branchiostoma belcheri]|nr:hypothetical protein Bbelb_429700 [Branchiostoma belcheri]